MTLTMAKILIVDDEQDILLMLRLNLEVEGHDVVEAPDGVAALEQVDAEHPDLMVLDVMMPRLDGWGVLERLRGQDGAPPVIVVSAKTSARDIAHAADLGACEYLTKPFDPDELVTRIDKVLHQGPEEREAHRKLLVQEHT